MKKDWTKLKVGEWAVDEPSAQIFLILKKGESSIDTDEGVGYFNAFFDESHFDHVDYHCRPATRKEIEIACEEIYNE
jgi:hypothetical protein